MVAQQWLVNTTVPGVDPADRRRLDLVLYGASPRGFALCCDATVVAPLRRDGQARSRAPDEDGAELKKAQRRKEKTYSELFGGGPARLVVLACEVGGRWGDGALRLVEDLVRLRTRSAPRALRKAAGHAWTRRWWALLSVAVQDAVAATLVEGAAGPQGGALGYEEPFLAEVLGDAPGGPATSRLPLRG